MDYEPLTADIAVMHVLVVEDAPELIMLFGFILESHRNITVSSRSDDFENTIAEVPWDDIDVAIVDWHLDDFDGRQILKWLSDEHPNIYRIMLTADSAVASNEVSAHQLLRKPVDAKTLQRAVLLRE